MTSAAARAELPAGYMLASSPVVTSRTAPNDSVGQLTDEEREEAIQRAGDLMERRYADFARTGDLADLGDAHRAMLLMKELVQGRSKGQVLRMEIRKGLI